MYTDAMKLEAEQIIELLKIGKTRPQIAEEYGVSVKVVSSILRRAGTNVADVVMESRHADAKTERYNVKEMALKYGVTHEAMRKWYAEHGYKSRDDSDETLKQRYIDAILNHWDSQVLSEMWGYSIRRTRFIMKEMRDNEASMSELVDAGELQSRARRADIESGMSVVACAESWGTTRETARRYIHDTGIVVQMRPDAEIEFERYFFRLLRGRSCAGLDIKDGLIIFANQLILSFDGKLVTLRTRDSTEIYEAAIDIHTQIDRHTFNMSVRAGVIVTIMVNDDKLIFTFDKIWTVNRS